MNSELLGRKVLIKNSGSHKKWVLAGYRKWKLGYSCYLRDEEGNMNERVYDEDDLEFLPKVELNKLPKGYQSTDHFRVHPDEATEWFAFVMMQAGVLFQNVPPGSWPEIENILTKRGDSVSSPVVGAAKAYYDFAEEFYKDDEDGE